MKRKTVTIKTLSDTFSLAVRERDDYTCQYPDCPKCGNHTLRYQGGLDCSHYHPRRHLSGRWYPDNCITLCRLIHQYVDTHRSIQVDLMKEILGEPCHADLIIRHHGLFKYKPFERAEMNDHYKAQTFKMERQRADGKTGVLTLTSWD